MLWKLEKQTQVVSVLMFEDVRKHHWIRQMEAGWKPSDPSVSFIFRKGIVAV